MKLTKKQKEALGIIIELLEKLLDKTTQQKQGDIVKNTGVVQGRTRA